MAHPHEKVLSDNQIAVTDLPEKTQKKIAKFAAETDDDTRDALDETIFGELEDWIEAQNAAKKAADKKAAHAAAKEAAKTAKVDVSGAPTAAGKKETPAAAAPAKTRTIYDRLYGRAAK